LQDYGETKILRNAKLFFSLLNKYDLADLNEIQILASSKYIKIYEKIKFEDIITLKNLKVSDVQKLQRMRLTLLDKIFLYNLFSCIGDVESLKNKDSKYLIEQLRKCKEFKDHSDDFFDEFEEYLKGEKFTQFDIMGLKLVKDLVENNMLDLTIEFIELLDDSIPIPDDTLITDKFNEFKEYFENKENILTKPNFIKYTEIINKNGSTIKMVLGEDLKELENIFSFYNNKEELAKIGQLLGVGTNITFKELILLKPPLNSDLKRVEAILNQKELDKYSETEFKALQELLKIHFNGLLNMASIKEFNYNLISTRVRREMITKYFKVLDENQEKDVFDNFFQLMGDENLKSSMKSVLTSFIYKGKVDVDQLVKNKMVANFENFIETPVSKSVADGLINIYSRTRNDGTWKALVKIVRGGAIEKLIELEKMVSFSGKVNYVKLEQIIKLIHEIGTFFFTKTLMIEEDMFEEEEEITIKLKETKKSGLKEWGKNLIPDRFKKTHTDATGKVDKLKGKTTKLKPFSNKHEQNKNQDR
jgi:hypothetical protein